jgi:hypothetical protein
MHHHLRTLGWCRSEMDQMEMSRWIVSSGHEPHRADRAKLRNNRSRRQQAGRWKPPIQVTGAALLLALTAPPTLARDRGQYANSSPEMKAWFHGLRSGKGPCCSDADGSAVSDVDWESRGGHYRVRIEGEWLEVPDDAVITEPNRVGRTMVWPMRGYQGLSIRCFMPGSMT